MPYGHAIILGLRLPRNQRHESSLAPGEELLAGTGVGRGAYVGCG